MAQRGSAARVLALRVVSLAEKCRGPSTQTGLASRARVGRPDLGAGCGGGTPAVHLPAD
jgi:hypothetical protein